MAWDQGGHSTGTPGGPGGPGGPDGPDDISHYVQAIAAEVGHRKEAFVAELVAVTRDEIQGLDHGDELAPWLVASIAENTGLLIELLLAGGDPRAAPVPQGALGYAVRLARAGIPVSALLRAYRFGQAMFTQMCLDVAADLEGGVDLRAVREMVDRVAAFIDHTCEVVGVAYDDEAARVASTPSGVRRQWVTRLLTDDSVDAVAAEAALGYPLRRRHVAAEIWTDAAGVALTDVLDKVVALIAAELHGAPSVVVPGGVADARAWFAAAADAALDATALATAIGAAGLEVRVATGNPIDDVAGFRRSHAQAVRTRQLAESRSGRPPAVTTYDEVAAVALLRTDDLELRDFVRRTLGPLAVDDERNRGLRETLRVFLDSNRLLDRAARRLSVHRNTVRYRVDQAIAIRGTSIDHDPLELMLALAAAKWLPAVLAGD